ncbi:unnamed protein product, partial [Timema podura]|nr:unnamed protein product [Timema podura]
MEVMFEVEQLLQQIAQNPSVRAAVLISGKPNCFIAGADINLLQACKTTEEVTSISRTGQQILANIENSKKPIIAAIQGSCLGGGLEKHKSKVNEDGMRYLRNVCGKTRMDKVSDEWALKECGLKGNTMG